MYTAMGPVAGGDAQLQQALAEHVLTGGSTSVLQDVASYQAALHLAVVGHYVDNSPARDALVVFAGLLPEMPDEVVLRWANLLTAALAGTPEHTPPDLVGRPIWPEALLLHLGNVFYGHWISATHIVAGIDHPWLERVLTAGGLDPASVLVAAVRTPLNAPGEFPDHRVTAVRAMSGYEDAVRRHTAALRAAIEIDKVGGQRSMLRMLRSPRPLPPRTLAPFAPEIAGAAVSSSVAARDSAKPLLDVPGVTYEIRKLAERGTSEQRLQALKLLWATEDRTLRQWALERAAGDRSANVRDLATLWAPPDDPAGLVDAQSLPSIDLRVPLTDELRGRLEMLFATPPPDHQNMYGERKLVEADLRRLLETLETGYLAPGRPLVQRPHVWARYVLGPQVAALGPVLTTAIYAALDLLVEGGYKTALTADTVNLYSRFFHETGHPTLPELAALLDAAGLDGRTAVLERYTARYRAVLGRDWPDEAVAPFIQTVLPHLLEMLQRSGDWPEDDDGVFRALATLPVLPKVAVEALMELAVGSRKAQRRPAQDVLAKVDGFEEFAVGALSTGKAEVRMVAAQWLQRLEFQAAVPALEAAVGREKNDLVKGALLDALESLGRPIEEYLDREVLARQAETGLAKGLPKDLAWLNWELVPVVHWSDSGDEVPRSVLQWLAVQAVKTKSSEPNVMLRKYCGLLVPDEREVLGQYLLEAWLAQDVAVISADEAMRRAEQEAANRYRWHSLHPQHYGDDPLFGLSQADIAGRLLTSTSAQLAGSAASSKGILAIVAACAGAGAAAPVGRYLKQWFGTRASQGKALIGMLAWIDHPSAIQLMLSIGSRFRTKAFQDEATRQATALAERNGWTVDELADRSVPVAGFDDEGRIELSYGDRVFIAELQPDLTISLISPEGKTIKALPAARQSDDEDAVKAAKKTLTAAKRELKSVVELQSNRLYEALCTERTWPAADWQRYLNGHPIMRRLLQRLAWIADDKIVFRPLEDGTLTDADDDPVELADDAVVRLAHDTLLAEDVVQSWQRHFADYEVVPLFQQFGKGVFRLPPERADDQRIGDFEGHIVEAFTLRGRTGKLGYQRGTPQDAGWFYEYEKRFASIGLTIVVNFTGNFVPEENRPVALRDLHVVRVTDDRYGGGVLLRLGDVPAVLLSEAYNDVRLMAADGSGFDPDWEKKSEY